jgi:hypothetical protein
METTPNGTTKSETSTATSGNLYYAALLWDNAAGTAKETIYNVPAWTVFSAELVQTGLAVASAISNVQIGMVNTHGGSESGKTTKIGPCVMDAINGVYPLGF